jgi:anti-sigma factor RsiW
MRDGELWQALNAYADGELTGEARARLQARLAEDPAAQASLDQITAVKRVLAAGRPAGEPADRSWRRPAAALAACVVAALLGLAAYLPVAPDLSWQERLVAGHVGLSDETFVVEQNRPLPVVSSRRLNDFAVPDLRASRLYLVTARSRQDDGAEYLYMHYRGLRGCSLTIAAVSPLAPGSGAGEAWAPAQGRLFAGWQAGRMGFAVIAEGMDEARFLAIADYVKAAIAESLEPEDPLRTAMAETYRAALPCA